MPHQPERRKGLLALQGWLRWQTGSLRNDAAKNRLGNERLPGQAPVKQFIRVVEFVAGSTLQWKRDK